jgi:23S rRNA (pseudouridine1915-N3)-methyltransferase
MKIIFLSVGKKHEVLFEDAILHFTKRASFYNPVSWEILSPSKNPSLPIESQKKEEGERILSFLKPSDYCILLDETGKNLSSEDLSQKIEERKNEATERLVFIIGGAFGVSEEVKKRANFTFSLSKLVFPHMLVRLILAETVYRSLSILAGDKYHHE